MQPPTLKSTWPPSRGHSHTSGFQKSSIAISLYFRPPVYTSLIFPCCDTYPTHQLVVRDKQSEYVSRRACDQPCYRILPKELTRTPCTAEHSLARLFISRWLREPFHVAATTFISYIGFSHSADLPHQFYGFGTTVYKTSTKRVTQGVYGSQYQTTGLIYLVEEDLTTLKNGDFQQQELVLPTQSVRDRANLHNPHAAQRRWAILTQRPSVPMMKVFHDQPHNTSRRRLI